MLFLFVLIFCNYLYLSFVISVTIICYTYINTFPICNNYLSSLHYILTYFVISYISLFVILIIYHCNYLYLSFILSNYLICYIILYPIILSITVFLYDTPPFFSFFCPQTDFLLFYHYYYYIYLYIIAHFPFLFFFLHATQNFIQKN